MHSLDQLLDEGGGLGADDVAPEQPARVAVGDDFGDALGVLQGPSVAGSGIGLDMGHVWETLFPALAFGQPHRGDLVMAEHGMGMKR